MLNDVLFELGTEELPSGAVWPLVDALANHLSACFLRDKIEHGEIRRFATPRRLAVLIRDVAASQAPQAISRRGPAYAAGMSADGQPLPPLLGFAKSCGVSVDALTTTKTNKGEWWAYEAVSEGLATKTVLPDILQECLAALPIAKLMRWGSSDALFVRPVHWAVLLFGDEVIKTSLLGVETGRKSFGHRFHHPGAIEIPQPQAYEGLLEKAFVVADFSTRRERIVSQIEQLASANGYQAVMPDALLDEVTSIVEWPVALLAHFERAFLDVPAEALIAAMQSHQKCFALQDKHKQLLPCFITVSNILSTNPEQVIHGNEKVMRARLSDAAFFYRQDKRQALGQYSAQTATVMFQARLGSLHDKMMRLQKLIKPLVEPLQLDSTEALRAAELSKCDLMTGMVNEFPELQGLMGYYYASHDGETNSVAVALNEQYMPRFAADNLPQSALGLALSLVDRLDTLVGAFAIGQKPTGDKDPFKLRRHALAVVRLLIATPAPLKLSTLLEDALHAYGEAVGPVDDAFGDLKPFILERMQSFYQSQGISAELVLAVRARQDEWFCDLDKRINALLTFITLPEAGSLSAACKRVNNLLQHTAITLKEVDPSLFVENAEKTLFKSMQSVEKSVLSLYSEGNYVQILSQLAGLKEPVDAFFDEVMVMAEDAAIKENRLSLLARLQTLLQGVADISMLKFNT